MHIASNTGTLKVVEANEDLLEAENRWTCFLYLNPIGKLDAIPVFEEASAISRTYQDVIFAMGGSGNNFEQRIFDHFGLHKAQAPTLVMVKDEDVYVYGNHLEETTVEFILEFVKNVTEGNHPKFSGYTYEEPAECLFKKQEEDNILI